MDRSGTRKITRRKGACMNCRQRKVRCDGSTTCSECTKLSLQCTYNTGPRRRSDNSWNAGLGLGSKGSPQPSRDRDEQRLQPDVETFSTKTLQDDFGSDFSTFLLDSDLSSSFEPSGFDTAYVGQLVTPDTSPTVLLSTNYCASSVDEHPLDHDMTFGNNHDWSRIWREDLGRDFSSMAPLRFLSKFMKTMPTPNNVEPLHKRMWTKIRNPPRKDETDRQYRSVKAPLSYSHKETLEFVNLFFNDPYRHPPFVTQKVVDKILVNTVRAAGKVSRCAFALLNSILAIGCRAWLRKHHGSLERTLPDYVPRPWQYFECALNCRNDLMNGESSLLKLQALVAMILFQRHDYNIPATRAMLSQAIHMIPDLTLATPTSLSSSEEAKLEENVERIFWVLYSIEKPYTLRFGGHSMIDDDLLVYPAPSKRRVSIMASGGTEYSGWEVVHYRYARLCSVIVKTLYSHVSLKMSPSETVASLNRLSSMVESWRLSIPIAYRPNCSTGLPEGHDHAWNSCIQTDIFLKYAESSFAIHRWAIATETYVPELASSYISSRDQCVTIAKSVLCALHSFSVTDVEMDWHPIMLSIVSASVLYMFICKRESGKDCLPYLGMACGFFGRLHTSGASSMDLFDEISELYLLAHHRVNGDHDKELLPESSESSAGDQGFNMEFDSEHTLETGLDGLQYLEFPQDIPDSIFDIASLGEWGNVR